MGVDDQAQRRQAEGLELDAERAMLDRGDVCPGGHDAVQAVDLERQHAALHLDGEAAPPVENAP
eukprot:3108361-Pyramimonas_sp.AAC.1